MKTPQTNIIWAFVALLALGGCATTGDRQQQQQEKKDQAIRVSVPAGIRHEAYDQLLKKYVDERGLVAYGAWANNPDDVRALDDYLRQYAASPSPAATGRQLEASLLNAYNAFVLQWILQNYPVDSIWSTARPFENKRHRVGGRLVSLNDIEHETLVPLMGYRPHGLLVCAAISCPPLQGEAFQAGRLDRQIDHWWRTWLARPDLNKFHPEQSKVEISSIFNWFEEDFASAGGVRAVLPKYAPAEYRAFLNQKNYEIAYLPYEWGLNDQAGRGERYNKTRFYLDILKGFFRR